MLVIYNKQMCELIANIGSKKLKSKTGYDVHFDLHEFSMDTSDKDNVHASITVDVDLSKILMKRS